jgi:hypothetical protein
MLKNALLWLTREMDGDASPRVAQPVVAEAANAGRSADRVVAPGSLIAISGAQFTSGSRLDTTATPLPVKLAGAQVRLNGSALPLAFVGTDRILAQAPFDVPQGEAQLTVSAAMQQSAPLTIKVERAAPGVIAVARPGFIWTIYCTGLGDVAPPVATGLASPLQPLSLTRNTPEVTVAGGSATVLYSGLAPFLVGVYQIIAAVHGPSPDTPTSVVVSMQGRSSPPFEVPAP